MHHRNAHRPGARVSVRCRRARHLIGVVCAWSRHLLIHGHLWIHAHVRTVGMLGDHHLPSHTGDLWAHEVRPGWLAESGIRRDRAHAVARHLRLLREASHRLLLAIHKGRLGAWRGLNGGLRMRILHAMAVEMRRSTRSMMGLCGNMARSLSGRGSAGGSRALKLLRQLVLVGNLAIVRHTVRVCGPQRSCIVLKHRLVRFLLVDLREIPCRKRAVGLRKATISAVLLLQLGGGLYFFQHPSHRIEGAWVQPVVLSYHSWSLPSEEARPLAGRLLTSDRLWTWAGVGAWVTARLESAGSRIRSEIRGPDIEARPGIGSCLRNCARGRGRA